MIVDGDFTEISFHRYHSVSCNDVPSSKSNLGGNDILNRGSIYQSSKEMNVGLDLNIIYLVVFLYLNTVGCISFIHISQVTTYPTSSNNPWPQRFPEQYIKVFTKDFQHSLYKSLEKRVLSHIFGTGGFQILNSKLPKKWHQLYQLLPKATNITKE